MWTDASGNFGMGGYYLAADELLSSDQAYSQRFSSRLQLKHINVKETRAVFFGFLALVTHFGWQARSTLRG